MLKNATVKRLLKKAYKEGSFTVGQTEAGWLYITDYHWVICVDFRECPKEIKAAVMEFAGELPEAGKAFTVQKDSPNQYKIVEEVFIVPNHYQDTINTNKCKETNIIFSWGDKRYRMMDAVDTAHVVREDFLDLLNQDSEGIEGPFCPDPTNPSFIWHTGLVYLQILPLGFHQGDVSDKKSEFDAVAAAFGMKVHEY